MNNKNHLIKYSVLIPVFFLILVIYRFMQLDSKQIQPTESAPTRVEAMTITTKPLTRWVFSEGTVQAKRKAFLDFDSAGKVVKISKLVDGSQLREGSRVFGPDNGARNGQLLAQIDSRESSASVTALEARLQATRAQKKEVETRIEQSINELKLNQQNYERNKKVYDQGIISSEQFDRINTTLLNSEAAVRGAKSQLQSIGSEIEGIIAEINRATVSLEKTSLFAPFGGVITALNINVDNHYYPPMNGSTDKDKEISSAIVLIDDSEFEVQLEIATSDAHLIEEGQKVYLAGDDTQLYQAARSQFMDSDVVEGSVWSVSPAINLQRRSQTVKVRITDQQDKLKEGQFVRAWVNTKQISNAAQLPLHALSFKNGQPYVMLIDQEKQVSYQPIKIGVQGLTSVEVLAGIKAGDRIVTRGQHLLINGSEVFVIGDQ